jgi:pimeloyl-ACP methyl ester carboxylesterase
VQIAHTKLGTVAYRAAGSGPPLVLITGYGGTMEGWDRRFVDALAEHYRVVIFDNAGIGGTQALPGPLGIDAMANQTSALIGSLGLGRPDVLGWSMGSMIAQALAVLHPDQVNRLILCASYPGNGTAIRPSQQAINALNSGDQQEVTAGVAKACRRALNRAPGHRRLQSPTLPRRVRGFPARSRPTEIPQVRAAAAFPTGFPQTKRHFPAHGGTPARVAP